MVTSEMLQLLMNLHFDDTLQSWDWEEQQPTLSDSRLTARLDCQGIAAGFVSFFAALPQVSDVDQRFIKWIFIIHNLHICQPFQLKGKDVGLGSYTPNLDLFETQPGNPGTPRIFADRLGKSGAPKPTGKCKLHAGCVAVSNFKTSTSLYWDMEHQRMISHRCFSWFFTRCLSLQAILREIKSSRVWFHSGIPWVAMQSGTKGGSGSVAPCAHMA